MGFEFDFGDSEKHSILDDFKIEAVSKKILESSSTDLVNGVKTAVRQSVKHSGQSELVDSVKAGKPYESKNGAYAVAAYFAGKSNSGNSYTTTDRGRPRVKPVRNADKAFWLEYGTLDGRQQAAPWRDRAVNNIEEKITPKMQKEFEEALGAE